jgi:hypothetical protein
MPTSDGRPLSCAGCGSCPTDDCPARYEDDAPRLRGPALVAAALALFLLPILLAVAGSALAGQAGDVAQLLGCLAGLGLGLAVARLFARLIYRAATRPDLIPPSGGDSPSL